MIRQRLDRSLDSPRIPLLAAAISLVIGLTFVFVWAPHPWGWHGIDLYHELARALARGEPFSTTDVPWGYAYFVAAFYWLFGERAWIPVTAQAVANAGIPLMMYPLVRAFASRRVAAIATLLIGAFSFNTVYASTESSDAICTVLFVGGLLCFARGYLGTHSLKSFGAIALSGLIAGTVPQFRPNMLLLPAVMAAGYVVLSQRRRLAVAQMAVFLVCVAIALAPWVVRNYWLTGAILPTSTHGGVQLWYGTLQVGPYIESRAYNPRSVFEATPFDYTSMIDQSILVDAEQQSCAPPGLTTELVYYTNRDAHPRSLQPVHQRDHVLRFEIPAQPEATTIHYHFVTQWSSPDASGVMMSHQQITLPDEESAPLVYFVSSQHLRDLDAAGDLIDVFDVVRLMRHVAWGDALGPTPGDWDGDGRTDERDITRAATLLVGRHATVERTFPSRPLDVSEGAVTLRFSDGSTLTVPRAFAGAITDLEIRGRHAGSLIPAHRPLRQSFESGALRTSHVLEASPAQAPDGVDKCARIGPVRINDVFYRQEPHLMRRYMALAFDNISRDPWAFAAASAYRMGRLFVMRGSDDVQTTQQFGGSRLVYLGGLTLSAIYLGLFVIGVGIAWRSRSALMVFVVPVVYVPLTICFVLTNMRYSLTVQPLMFIFIAVAIDALLPYADWKPGRHTTFVPSRGAA
jgi:Dolichyl-phosphate-mannose-protein mannosyltransferase